MKSSESSEGKTTPLETTEDKAAQFYELFNSHQDAIFRFLYFRAGNRAVALDITQDTFTKVWMYLASGKTIEYGEAFLYRTAKNALIDYYKKSKSLSLDSMSDSGFDPGSDKVVEDVLKEDDIQTIQSLVSGLDEESKQIIYLRYAEEKPIEEIATMYGKSVNAMTVHIHRIVKKLRSKFTDIQN